MGISNAFAHYVGTVCWQDGWLSSAKYANALSGNQLVEFIHMKRLEGDMTVPSIFVGDASLAPSRSLSAPPPSRKASCCSTYDSGGTPACLPRSSRAARLYWAVKANNGISSLELKNKVGQCIWQCETVCATTIFAWA